MRDTVLTLKRLFGEEWKNLMLLSIAAAVFSLPLITIGPSLLALHGVLMRIMDGTCDLDRFREFRSLFRACFWRGLMLEAAAAGYLLVLFWCVALQDAMGSGKAALQTALWVSLFLAGGVAVYLIPLLADKSLSGRQALRGAVDLAVLCLPQTVLATLALYGSIFLFALLYPVSFLLYLLFGLGALAAVTVSLVWPGANELLYSEEA